MIHLHPLPLRPRRLRIDWSRGEKFCKPTASEQGSQGRAELVRLHHCYPFANLLLPCHNELILFSTATELLSKTYTMPSSSKRPASSDYSDMEVFPRNFREPSFASDDDVFGTATQGGSSANKFKPASPSNKKKAPVTPRKSVTRPDASSSLPKTPPKKARNSNTSSSSAPLTIWSGEQDIILMKRIAELCISQRSFFYETPELEGWKGNGGSTINSKLKQLLTRAGKAVVGVTHLPDEFIEKKPGGRRAAGGAGSNNNTPRQSNTTSPSPIIESAANTRPRPRPRVTLPPTPPTPLGSPAGSECDHSPVATSGFPWTSSLSTEVSDSGPSSLQASMRQIALESILTEGPEVFEEQELQEDDIQEDTVRAGLSKRGHGLDDAIELSD
jgi:hypothetical protein